MNLKGTIGFKTGRRTCVKVNAMSYAILVKLLVEGTRTCEELAQDTGLHKLTVYQYTRELYKAGVLHICAWEADMRGRDIVKVYRLGEEKDAPRNKDSGAERARRYRAKKEGLVMIGRMVPVAAP